jgi:hypothetical protein
MRTFGGLRSAASQQVGKSESQRVGWAVRLAPKSTDLSSHLLLLWTFVRIRMQGLAVQAIALRAEFHLLLLWTFVRIRLQLPGKNRANGMRGLQTFLRAGS